MVNCAKCGKELNDGDAYYFVPDQDLKDRYFGDPAGMDNMFCSKDCAPTQESLKQGHIKVDDEGVVHLYPDDYETESTDK
ncbi:hypothetical protein FOD75_10900 (plasmid) [Limosilactobacillus reuteri]|uniref:Uncharacterized protein n=1 Tax=Limosilactobacillus reuteri TaxID=1598 RepID=A0A517D8I8_LIMRT|nr:hypothetical protein [Limosilactobacillus reuteri]QDR73597.1 hypothetical protein FOD75_10900 [Limosilactobacillus reuteri]